MSQLDDIDKIRSHAEAEQLIATPVPLGCDPFNPDRYPHYKLVPKTLKENMIFRHERMKDCANSAKQRNIEMEKCRDDLLYWVNTYATIYEPRNEPATRVLPFITWQYQDPFFQAVEDAIGHHDLCIRKSRDMAGSWGACTVFGHQFIFHEASAFLVASRKFDLVDKYANNNNDPGTLLGKIDILLRKLPPWMKPEMRRISGLISNKDNGSLIVGEETNPNIAAGNRLLAILLDELSKMVGIDRAVMAATHYATRCRLAVFTPEGAWGEAYNMATNPAIKQVILHWSQNPTMNKGLKFDAKRPYNLTSPYYEQKVAEASNPWEVASQLDISFSGSGAVVFDPTTIDRQIANATDPLVTGDFAYDPELCRPSGFLPNVGNKWKLWFELDEKGRPPIGDYVIGIDVSAGSGYSNSAMAVGDRSTGKKVASFADPHTQPQDLAAMAISFARWLHGARDGSGAMIIHEMNGPGGIIFSKTLLKHKYYAIYWRTDEVRLRRKRTDIPGFWSTKESKNALIAEYARAMKMDKFINPDREALDECRMYIIGANGSYEHANESGKAWDTEGSSKDKTTGARMMHGDRVIADALLSKIMLSSTQRADKIEPKRIVKGSLAERRAIWKQQELEAELASRNYY